METARRLYHRWLDELWSGEPGAAERLVTEGFVGHWPDRDVHGPAALAARVAQVRSTFPDLALGVLLGPIVDGEFVAARWVARRREGTNQQTVVGNDILRVEDDRVAEHWPSGPVQPMAESAALEAVIDGRSRSVLLGGPARLPGT